MLSPVEANPNIEVEVLFGIDEKPSFVSIVFNKIDFSVTLYLNEPENDEVEVDIEDDVEILRIQCNNLDAARKHYKDLCNPYTVDRIIREYKSKE